MVGKPDAGKPRGSRRAVLVRARGAAGLLAAACGVSGGPGAGGPAGGTLDQPASLLWLNWETGVAQVEGNNKSVATFQAQHPQIKVENASVGGGTSYWDKHASLKAAGAPPDLWEWEPKHVVDYVSRKQVFDIQPLVARDKHDLNDFFKKGVDQYRWRTGLWGLPRDFPNRNLLYSVTAFQKDGLKRPSSDWKQNDWTWDAFLDATRRLNKPDGSQFGFNTGKGFREWAPWVWSNGGEIIDEQRLEVVLDRGPAVDGLQFLQDLIHKHRVMPQTLPAGQNFAAGNVGIQEGIPANLGNLRRDIGTKFVFDVVMHPKSSAGRYVAAGGGAGWAMDAATKATDAAWAFLKHVTSSAEQIQVCEVGATIGSRRSVMTHPCFAQTPPEHVKLFIDGTDYLHVDVRVAGWTEVEKVLNEELAYLWSGERPARAVAASIKSKADPILKAEAQRAGA
jgi:multiple sugar transport system substrate-binding protein